MIDADNIVVSNERQQAVFHHVCAGGLYEVNETEVEYLVQDIEESDEAPRHWLATVKIVNPIWRGARELRMGRYHPFWAVLSAAACIAAAYQDAKISHAMVEV